MGRKNSARTLQLTTAEEEKVMPLPEKLKKGASKSKKKKVVAETMHDLKHGPHHKDRTHRQEVAIAIKQSGQARTKESTKHAPKGASGKPGRDGDRKKRNKGRH
jgi:hypothetical protein